MYREPTPPPPDPPPPAPRETYRALWGLTAIVTMPLASCTGLAIGLKAPWEWHDIAPPAGAIAGIAVVIAGTVALMRARTAPDKVDPPAATTIGYLALSAMAALSLLGTWLFQHLPGEPGRPFRGPLGPRRARKTKRRDWIAPLDLPSPSRDARIAAKWEGAALAEHASVASFAQLSLDLLELGAPPDLIRRCHLAAIEEIDHAEKSFALASAYAGEPIGPSALPVPRLRRRATFARVRRESIVDGCMNERRAAEDLRAEAERQTDERIREMLSRIADDEEGHVRLAEDVVRFCTQRDRMTA